MKRTKLNVKTLVLMGLLTAIEIVLSRFLSISAWNMKIGFAFVPVVIAAMLLGPVCAAVVGGLADFLGAMLFPIGAYFPGFTATAFLTGLVFGLFLYKQQRPFGIIGSVGINQIILSLGLNTLWISMLYGTPYEALLATRLVQCAVYIPVQILVIFAVAKLIEKMPLGDTQDVER